MGDYTKLTREQACAILQKYGHSEVHSLTPLSLGISNSNYKVVTEKDEVLLKVSNDKNLNELSEEMELLQLLAFKEYSYSLEPFHTQEGQLTYEYEDLHGVAFPFITGLTPGPSDHACREIGKALAKLHTLEVFPQERDKIRNHEKVGFGAKEIYEYTKSSACPQDFKDIFNLAYPHQLTWFMEFEWERGIIHGDLYIDNTMFESNDISVLLDFEQAGIGEYILDLGIAISGCCLEKGLINRGLAESFLQGYQELRNLTSHERQNLTDSIILGLLSISLWRIKRFKDKDLNPILVNSYKELLLRAKCFREQFKSRPLMG